MLALLFAVAGKPFFRHDVLNAAQRLNSGRGPSGLAALKRMDGPLRRIPKADT
jgi:hypothetical protein